MVTWRQVLQYEGRTQATGGEGDIRRGIAGEDAGCARVIELRGRSHGFSFSVFGMRCRVEVIQAGSLSWCQRGTSVAVRVSAAYGTLRI